MKVRNPWRRELLLLAAWLVLAAGIGALANATAIGLLFALFIYLGLQLIYAFQLHQWIMSDRIEPAYGTGIWQEIYTALYRLKQRNRRRKKRLRSIVGEFQASTMALPDGAVVLNADLCIVWFNGAAEDLLGLESPVDRGQRVANLIRHPQFSAFIGREPGDETAVEIPAPGDDAKTVQIRIVPYGNRQRLLIARDISQQRRLEATRREFVANASHELRTPLTVLRGYLEILDDDVVGRSENAEWRAPVAQMAAEAQRMDRMIDDLLALARLESDEALGADTWTDITPILQQAADKAPPGSAVIEFEPPTDAWVYGRASQLESIAVNLVTNACRYTPSDGHITLDWTADAAGGRLRVTDTGCGIASAHIPRLTERFYRVDPGRSSESGGTGLGLAIVKHALGLHDATLHIESTAGQGSTFTCRFPAGRVRTALPAQDPT